VASIVEVVGISHYWGVTVNGVATIYILICVGLAVDYAAHIAHAFKDSFGTGQERSMQSLERIGPSVFHALFSTVIAIIVIGFSKSYIFKVFFKVIFLVTIIAGSHGLWLLPAILAMMGGEKQQSDGDEQKTDVEKAQTTMGFEGTSKSPNEDTSLQRCPQPIEKPAVPKEFAVSELQSGSQCKKAPAQQEDFSAILYHGDVALESPLPTVRNSSITYVKHASKQNKRDQE